MALKKFHSSKNDIPEGQEGFYVETDDGTWVLDVEGGFKSDEDVGRSQTALQRERKEHQETKKKLKKFESLGEYDEVAGKLDQIPELEAIASDKGDVSAQVEALVEKRLARAVNPLKRQITELTEERDNAMAQVSTFTEKERTRTVRDKARAALQATKARDSAIDDAMMYADSHFEVLEDGRTVVTREGLDGIDPGLSPEVWAKEMQRRKAHWWPDLSGGGSNGASGPNGTVTDNPFSPKTLNMTKAAQIVRDNPAEAKRMVRAAGENPAKFGLTSE